MTALELVEQLTTEQLRHVLACREALEQINGPTLADEVRKLEQQADPETTRAFDRAAVLHRTARAYADLWRPGGVMPHQTAASAFVRVMVGDGYDEADARDAFSEAWPA